jgi:hypothetical protein
LNITSAEQFKEGLSEFNLISNAALSDNAPFSGALLLEDI